MWPSALEAGSGRYNNDDVEDVDDNNDDDDDDDDESFFVFVDIIMKADRQTDRQIVTQIAR